MIKFIKTKDETNHFDHTNLIMETESETLGDLLEDFTDFLKGCGYYPKGRLDFIEEEE